VDQQKIVSTTVVEAVAKDFDLGDSTAVAVMTVAPPANNADKFDLVEALRTLATLADRLRQSEQDLPKERKI